jgi:hypothetical protein
MDMAFCGISKWKVVAFMSVLVAGVAFAPLPASAAEEKCGILERMEPMVVAVRSGEEWELYEGDIIYNSDIIRTEQTGFARIKLIDGTAIELRENGEMLFSEVRFDTEQCQLHMSIDRGSARVELGSIGLANPKGVRISTPKALITSSNATFKIETWPLLGESVTVERLPKGGTASVLNVITKDTIDVKTPGYTVVLDEGGALPTPVSQDTPL